MFDYVTSVALSAAIKALLGSAAFGPTGVSDATFLELLTNDMKT
jgi:hypothetical protein